MARQYLKIAPAVILVLAICSLMVLPGCNSVIQPGQEKLAGASYFLRESPVDMTIRMVVSNKWAKMSYESKINAQGSAASWDGLARTEWQGYILEQICKTRCDGKRSYKGWRSRWVATDNVSPTAQVEQWLQEVEAGKGTYPKRPTTPAQCSDLLSDVTCEVYQVTLTEQPIQWKSLCDAHPDSLFGGQQLLTQFEKATVTLFFGTEDLTLKAAMVSSATEAGALELVMILTPATTGPVLDLDSLEVGKGYPHEEWNFPEDE